MNIAVLQGKRRNKPSSIFIVLMVCAGLSGCYFSKQVPPLPIKKGDEMPVNVATAVINAYKSDGRVKLEPVPGYKVVKLISVEYNLAKPIYGIILEQINDPKKVMIAIRGSVNLLDAVADESSNMVPFTDIVGNSYPNQGVEDGFFGIYSTYRAQIFEYLNDNKDINELVIGGHSSGGAGALLALQDILYSQILSGKTIKVYVYGSPKPGSKGFSEALISNAVANGASITSFINDKDVVPNLPFSWKYRYKTARSQYKLCFYDELHPKSLTRAHSIILYRAAVAHAVGSTQAFDDISRTIAYCKKKSDGSISFIELLVNWEKYRNIGVRLDKDIVQ